MQFINIVVHSVEEMNFRVHLQHEFTLIGLDEYLEVSQIYLFKFVLRLFVSNEKILIEFICQPEYYLIL